MGVLVLCLVLSLAAPATAQTSKPAPKPAQPARPAAAKPAAIPTAHFSATNLNNEDDFLRIYSGDFQQVRLDRTGTEFMASPEA
jgi:hypothetical protein